MAPFGLAWIDLFVIVGYFLVVMLVGFWASRKVHDEEDFFLGGRRFGPGLLLMHWLCTGTHSDMAVQTAGACARVGLGGIWYQWMYLFSTPFYWLIAPLIRRLRVVSTGDVYRIRYGLSLELFASGVGLVYLVLGIALLLRGAGELIAGVTGGALVTDTAVVGLAILFSTYVMTGGLMAAAYTDFLQGVMLILLSVLLVPAGLQALGGPAALATQGAERLAVTAPAGAREGDPWFVLSLSVLGLVGIVAQPHVITANGSGKTESESRIGMCYGNLVKRLLTIAWALTGLIAYQLFPEVLANLDPSSLEARIAGDKLYGLAIRQLLGEGWRGLMIACIIAGVTSGEALMVVGSALFTRNFFQHLAPQASAERRLLVGRIAAAGILVCGILTALRAPHVTALYLFSVKLIALLGPIFWMGVLWRRATPTGAWASLAAGLLLWAATAISHDRLASLPGVGPIALGYTQLKEPIQILIQLVVQFGILMLGSLLSRPPERSRLDPFYARLLTPVGKEASVALDRSPDDHPQEAGLGLHQPGLDYHRAADWGYAWPRRFGFEIPRLGRSEWGGFLLAWGVVAGLLMFLITLSRGLQGVVVFKSGAGLL
jgi:Na+/proline symporter